MWNLLLGIVVSIIGLAIVISIEFVGVLLIINNHYFYGIFLIVVGNVVFGVLSATILRTIFLRK